MNYRFLVQYICCCFCRKEQEKLEKRFFYNRWLDVIPACDPDEILWENQGVSKLNECCRLMCVSVIVILITIACIIGLVQFKVQSENKIVEGYNTSYNCPKVVEKTLAFEAFHRHNTGLMHCYCLSQATAHPKDFFRELFEDGVRHCYEWLLQYSFQYAMVIGTSVMIATINAVACIIFDKITYFEAKKTMVEETYSKFVKITVMQFFNISVIILLINFNLNGFRDSGVTSGFNIQAIT